ANAPAQATAISKNFNATASVAANCQMSAVGDLSFGAYDPVVANATSGLTGNTSFTLKCTRGASPVISLSVSNLNFGQNVAGKRRTALALGPPCGAGPVRASALNISPVQIWLTPDASKSLLTLRNEGPEDARYQRSVMAWDEDARTGMKLGPTEDILVFPTVL